MSRKSSLNGEQWIEVGNRLLQGESPPAIAKDFTARGFPLSDSTIRSHFKRKGQNTKTVQEMAGQVYDAEQAVKAAENEMRAAHKALQIMPAAAQVATMTLVQRMRSMSESLAVAADYSAKTAMGLAAKANSEHLKIDDADPMKSGQALASTVLLQKAANEAAKLPTNLIAAAGNRDLVNRANENEFSANTDEVLTPERLQEGARRVAFLLHRAAKENT